MSPKSSTGASAYRSFAEQTRHYFSRPHEGLPEAPLTGPSVWRGAELRAQPERWRVQLEPEDTEEIRAAAKAAMARGLPLAEVSRAEFPLPRLAHRVGAWGDRIRDGLGFVVVTGLDIEGWSQPLVEMAFWGIGHHLGLPGAQNPDQELLGHVRDYHERGGNPNVRLYRTSENIDFHCDAADVVGLLCLRPARSGGQSRIVSTDWLFNRVRELRPELVPHLFEPFKLDGRGEERPGSRPYSELAPCAYAGGRLRTFYHSEYMRSVLRHPGVTHTPAQAELLDLYDALAADPEVHLDMWLKAGDMQFLSNHSIAHARTAYEDDPAAPRHLLRLWLSFTP